MAIKCVVRKNFSFAKTLQYVLHVVPVGFPMTYQKLGKIQIQEKKLFDLFVILSDRLNGNIVQKCM